MTRLPRISALLFASVLGIFAPASQGQPATRTSAPEKAAEAKRNPAVGARFDPAGRRDPFLNLLSLRKKTSDDEVVEAPSMVPPGIGGMRISEVALAGTSLREGTYTAVVRGTDKRTYFLRAGDRLLDGFVQKIDADAVQFIHETKLRSGKVMTQEITKRLRPN